MGAKENIAINNNNIEPLDCLLIGDTNSGKTALLKRLTKNRWEGNDMISVGFDSETISLKNSNSKVKIIDIASHSFNHCQILLKRVFQKAIIIVIVYDITLRNSFENVPEILEQSYSNHRDAIYVLVGNKLDIKEKRKVFF